MPVLVEFLHSSPVYSSGDVIVGKVVVINTSNKPQKLSQGLSIKFVGKGWTKWKEGSTSRNQLRHYLVTRSANEVYFDRTIVLFPLCGDVKSIPPGRSEFPFLFELPYNLPSSFASKCGSVTYFTEVIYRRQCRADKYIKIPIYIIGDYSLNSESISSSMQPGCFTIEKVLNRGCWPGRIKVDFKIPKRGFILGETINFSLDISNESMWNLKKVCVYLTQIATFNAQGSFLNEANQLVKTKCRPVSPKEGANFEGCIDVPAHIPPTTSIWSQIIQIKYSLTLKVKASTIGQVLQSAVLEGRVPISIGTIPMFCQQNRSESLPPFQHLPPPPRRVTLFNETICPNTNYYSDDEDDPPSYEEAVLLFPKSPSISTSDSHSPNFFPLVSDNNI